LTDEIIINPGFRLHKFHREEWGMDYLDYRRAWDENPKWGIVGDYPLNLDIETTNRCNLKCPFCVRESMDEGVGDFSVENYEKIIKEIMGGKVKAMKFNWRGEPTLFKNLPKFIGMAKKAGVIETMINTNATLLTENMVDSLIASGLDRIIISVDSTEPELYRTQRVGAELDEVLSNIKMLLNVREEFKRYSDKDRKGRPYIRVQKVDLPEGKFENYVGFWSEFGVDAAAINTYKEKDDGKLGAWTALQCAQPFQRMIVTWKGDFVPCCQGQLFKPLGNIKDMTVFQAWHSPTMQLLRDKHKMNRQNEIPQCAKCETTRPL
jgi:radical SAM protein with 4Fe4S-binding SPASM domain